MNTRKLIIASLILISAAGVANGQDNNEFKPYGKPLVLVFSNFNTTFNSEKSSKAFEITRSYLGFEYFFSEKISSRVNIDIGDPGVGKLQMTAYVKNAYLVYKNNGFSGRFGMIGTDQFSVQEKQWGYRYIYKSLQDAYGFGPSADLGAALEYSPSGFVTFNLSILNGEGYKSLQSDSTFKETFGITITPIKGLTLRGYADLIRDNYNQVTYSFFAGYSMSKFRAGMEYNFQKNNGMKDQHDFSGISFYTTFIPAEKYNVFLRYDNLWSMTPDGSVNPWNYNKDGQLFMAGIDYIPLKGIRIAPTYSGWSPRNNNNPYTSTIALNLEIKF